MASETSLSSRSVCSLRNMILNRHVSVREIVSDCIDSYDKWQSKTNAFVSFDREQVLQVADAYDRDGAQGRINSLLHGIPVAVKDNYLTSDYPTTACSKVHDDWPQGIDSTVVALLRQAGAIVFGKTNMHEWAYGATNQVSSFGATKNPRNLDHITGGSSGGSGAALAAGIVPVALGSDTGGSVRIPAAACGVCGLKPTFGQVSRHGILPLAWSLDVAGPMARSVPDLKLLFSVMSGVDRNDPITYNDWNTNNRCRNLNRVSKLKIGVLSGEALNWSAEVDRSVNSVVRLLASDGAITEEICISGIRSGFAAWKVILHAEAAAYHAHFLNTRAQAYDESVLVQLEAGRSLSAAIYLKAQQHRSQFTRVLANKFLEYDCVILPTLPITAPKASQHDVQIKGKTITSQDAMTCLPWIANSTGFPAVTIPGGFGANGLPIGVSLLGVAGTDYKLLQIATWIENHLQLEFD